MLVFLPGQEDIEALQNLLEDHLPIVDSKCIGEAGASHASTAASHPVSTSNRFQILPLYASMSSDSQMAVFAPAPMGVRKFILATNIAETSVTINGIKIGELPSL